MGLSRSEQMSRIRGKNTSPEVLLRKALWSEGLKYRLHFETGQGKADLAFPGSKVAIFVDGCQWHGCPEHYVRPRSNSEFWASKLASNVSRDQRQTIRLREAGWTIVRVWEHEVFTDLSGCVSKVRSALSGKDSTEQRWRVVRVEPVPESADLELRHLESLGETVGRRTETRPRNTTKWRVPKASPKENPL